MEDVQPTVSAACQTMEDEQPAVSAALKVLEDEDLLFSVLAALPGVADIAAAAAVCRSWHAQCKDERLWRAMYLTKFGRAAHAQPPLQDVRVGSLGVLDGIVSRPELNGQMVSVLQWDAATGRWAVRFLESLSQEGLLCSGQPFKVRPANLKGTWRFRFRRRFVGDEFCEPVNLSGGSVVRHPRYTCNHVSPSGRRFKTGTSLLPGAFLVNETPHSAGLPGGGNSHATVRTDSVLHAFEDHIGYFEVSVTNSSVGLSCGSNYESYHRRHNHLGWRPTSYGYHSDDGTKWRADEKYRTNPMRGDAFGEPFGPAPWVDAAGLEDAVREFNANLKPRPKVVGVGIDYTRHSIFFTRAGVLQGTAFEGVRCAGSPQDVRDPASVSGSTAASRIRHLSHVGLHPSVTLHDHGDAAQFNFGTDRPFEFDVAAYAASDERRAAVVGDNTH